MEKSLSTFANEMASSAMILGVSHSPNLDLLIFVVGLATPDSLILIDEVGRGTSPLEGVGISHAIAERLIDIKVLVVDISHNSFFNLVTSHSYSLPRTQSSYFNLPRR